MSQNQSEHSPDHTVCRNPVTGDIVGYSPLTNIEELKQIIANARVAQKSWAKQAVKERVKYMVRVRDYLTQHAEEIAEVICRDNGKTRVDALATEVMPAAMAVDYYAKHARKFLKKRRILPGNILLLH